MGCTTSKLPSELQLSPRPTLDVKGPLSPIQEEAESASPVASTDFEIDNLINLYETGRLDEAPDTGSPVGAIDEKYQCEHDCGFVGTYAEVALHEDGCPARKPGGAPRWVSSCGSVRFWWSCAFIVFLRIRSGAPNGSSFVEITPLFFFW
eukprot:SAG11_NODE_365_length_10153_cov_3.204695_4_plen_150_part_00